MSRKKKKCVCEKVIDLRSRIRNWCLLLFCISEFSHSFISFFVLFPFDFFISFSLIHHKNELRLVNSKFIKRHNLIHRKRKSNILLVRSESFFLFSFIFVPFFPSLTVKVSLNPLYKLKTPKPPTLKPSWIFKVLKIAPYSNELRLIVQRKTLRTCANFLKIELLKISESHNLTV